MAFIRILMKEFLENHTYVEQQTAVKSVLSVLGTDHFGHWVINIQVDKLIKMSKSIIKIFSLNYAVQY